MSPIVTSRLESTGHLVSPEESCRVPRRGAGSLAGRHAGDDDPEAGRCLRRIRGYVDPFLEATRPSRHGEGHVYDSALAGLDYLGIGTGRDTPAGRVDSDDAHGRGPGVAGREIDRYAGLVRWRVPFRRHELPSQSTRGNRPASRNGDADRQRKYWYNLSKALHKLPGARSPPRCSPHPPRPCRARVEG